MRSSHRQSLGMTFALEAGAASTSSRIGNVTAILGRWKAAPPALFCPHHDPRNLHPLPGSQA